jgi:DNA polymerase-1
MESSRPRLFLIDTFGLIFRAFYGRARSSVPSMRTAAGLPTEAVFVFANMINRLVNDYKPDYLAAVWEGRGPTFRDEIFPEYKANRDEMPEDLSKQLPYIKRLLEAMSVPVLAEDGYEADDTIGSLAKQAADHDIDVHIVSSDKDLMQLVRQGVVMMNPMKNDAVFDEAGVFEAMGVKPSQIIDFLALKGDSVDNIPGAPGIGDKGARQLLADYGSIEGAIANAEEVKRKAYRESLQNNVEQIELSRKLATIATDGNLRLDLEALSSREPDQATLADFYREVEFRTLLSKIEGAPKPEPEVEIVERRFESAEDFESWLGESDEPVAVYVDTKAGDELYGGGIAFSSKADEACFLPAELIPAAKAFLEAEAERPKYVHDLKSTLRALEKQGITIAGVTDDTMLAAFLIDSSRTDYSLVKTVGRRLAVPFDGNPVRAAGLVRELKASLDLELESSGLREIYTTMEMPLAPVLRRMESAGVLLDKAALGKLSVDLGGKVAELEIEIQELAGKPFNVGSPKQLAEILFTDLELPMSGKRGKTNTPSTASDVLENLADEHPIAAKVLDYRQFTKLKNTYVDALPELADPDTHRVHTTFNPTGSATGRLSSVNPNLQNIPVRTEYGRNIRAAFIAAPGWQLVAADYSQIELRVLAHMCGDGTLTDAFKRGEDVHTRTAAEVFGIPPLMVGPDERRRAKAVNFGIIYGLSAFGLAKQLGIPQKEARAYIERYFAHYSAVKKFIDKTVDAARKTGYSKTMFGRRRPIGDLDSRNAAARGFAERIAVNSPIQGTAADLIKLAMLRVDERLRREGLQARMLLQVHDELLFEAPDSEVVTVGKLAKQEMEGVTKLSVPLIADLKAGPNWRDMVRVG